MGKRELVKISSVVYVVHAQNYLAHIYIINKAKQSSSLFKCPLEAQLQACHC